MEPDKRNMIQDARRSLHFRGARADLAALPILNPNLRNESISRILFRESCTSNLEQLTGKNGAGKSHFEAGAMVQGARIVQNCFDLSLLSILKLSRK